MTKTDKPHEHNFVELSGGGYFKLDAWGRHIQDKSYVRLFCSACGETREVVVREYR